MPKYYDTILGEYIKNPGKKGIGLDKLAEEYFDYQMISYDSITMNGRFEFSEVELVKAADYSAEDVYITNKLYEKQVFEGLNNDSVLKEIEIPLMEVLKEVELNGVKIDRDKLIELGKKLDTEIISLEKIIHHLAGKEFNIKSPKQVGEILFVDMGLPHGKKTKTGYSVDTEVLTTLSFEYEIAKAILNYRHYTKLKSTYIDGLLKLITNKDLVHTSYNQTVTTTGRLSSTNPNLQNIPSGDGLAGEIRKAFIPYKNDDLLMVIDYSQIELRLLAIMSEDENLLGAFKEGVDIHYNTACFIFGKDDISSNERKIAKAVNFGVIYGISAFGLSKMIGISMKEAKVYIEKFYEKYPKVLSFMESIKEGCREKGYVETMFGRKRYIKSINDSNAIIKKAAEREAINMPIQGSNADIIKIAMIKVSKFLKDNNLKSKMIMQVHDELVFNVKKNEEELLKKEIISIMENIIDAPIKLIADLGVGKNWGEAK